MENLILSEEMPVFSTKPDGFIHQPEDVDCEGRDAPNHCGHQRGDECPVRFMNQGVIETLPFSADTSGAECDVPSKLNANPCYTPDVDSTLAPTVASISVASSFHPSSESHMRPSTDLGSHGVTHVVGNGFGEVAQPPETLVAAAGFRGWGEVTEVAEDDDGLAVEDWLDVAHALNAVAEPKTASRATSLP